MIYMMWLPLCWRTHLLGNMSIIDQQRAYSGNGRGVPLAFLYFRSPFCAAYWYPCVIPIPLQTHPIAHAQSGVGARQFEFLVEHLVLTSRVPKPAEKLLRYSIYFIPVESFIVRMPTGTVKIINLLYFLTEL